MQMRSAVVLATLVFAAVTASAQTFTVPVEYFKLDNGLKVVVSTDRSAPVVLVEVIYNIGFRVEPKGRTGFAHLFEHMMFQGSANVKKMQHVGLMQEPAASSTAPPASTTPTTFKRCRRMVSSARCFSKPIGCGRLTSPPRI